MGNSLSLKQKKELKDVSFKDILDYVATKYILTMNFKSLQKLNEKDYCDDLIFLTSDIINKNFDYLEITDLDERIKNGSAQNIGNGVIFFKNKDGAKLLNNNINTPEMKKKVCLNIAKFYVKIAHIFASIVMTINPVYEYVDIDGNYVQKGLLEKNDIPVNAKEKNVYQLGICNEREYALANNYTENSINPIICGMNINEKGQIKNLLEEPGIEELEELYNDKYDYKTGEFIGMTDETKLDYQKDLEMLYTAFTGNSVLPPDIKKFSDIKLRDFQKLDACSSDFPIFDKKITLTDEQAENDFELKKLFEDYGNNLKKMMQTTKENQEKLLDIMNKLFSFREINPDIELREKRIRINPDLTEESLKQIVKETRNLIIELYLKCENDYINGIKIYQAIIEKKIKDTTIKQIEHLEKAAENLINVIPTQITSNKPIEQLMNTTPPDINTPSDIKTTKELSQIVGLSPSTTPYVEDNIIQGLDVENGVIVDETTSFPKLSDNVETILESEEPANSVGVEVEEEVETTPMDMVEAEAESEPVINSINANTVVQDNNLTPISTATAVTENNENIEEIPVSVSGNNFSSPNSPSSMSFPRVSSVTSSSIPAVESLKSPTSVPVNSIGNTPGYALNSPSVQKNVSYQTQKVKTPTNQNYEKQGIYEVEDIYNK